MDRDAYQNQLMSSRPPVIYWFRNDLRVHDNAALYQAVQAARQAGAVLWLVYAHDPAQQAPTRWGFARQGVHRRVFLRQTLNDLQQQLRACGQQLFEYVGAPAQVLAELCRRQGATQLYCEDTILICLMR
jgi:deoxyribodipyrimidine photo-lyase